MIASMPIFDELGLVSPEHPNSPVLVSFSDSASEEGKEDSEATEDDMAEISPQSWSELLRGFADDDDADEPPVVQSPCSTGVLTR